MHTGSHGKIWWRMYIAPFSLDRLPITQSLVCMMGRGLKGGESSARAPVMGVGSMWLVVIWTWIICLQEYIVFAYVQKEEAIFPFLFFIVFLNLLLDLYLSDIHNNSWTLPLPSSVTALLSTADNLNVLVLGLICISNSPAVQSTKCRSLKKD